jgi:Flp pilus assembly CpaE family ATPase
VVVISIEILKKLALFEGLEDSDLNKIFQVTKERSLPAGSILFREGDAGDAFFLLIDGGVEIIKKEGAAEKVVNTIEHTDKNSFFGEMALIEGAPRSATLRTSKDSKVLVIEKSNFDMMLRLNSFIALRIMSALSRRLRAPSTEKASEQKNGKVFAVFSPKSGSGKSVFSANLAAGLAKTAPGKVLLMDLDLQFGDLAFMLGLNPKRTIADLVDHPADKFEVLKEYLVEHKALGFHVLPGPLKPEQSEMINSSHLRQIIDLARKNFDYIILDTHSFFQDLTINAMDIADAVYLMMVPNMNHILNMHRCLKVMENLKYQSDKIKLVLNRNGCQNGKSIEEIEAGLKRKIDYPLADDFAAINQLVDSQKTVFQLDGGSNYLTDLGNIVKAITGKDLAGAAGGGGLLGKLKGFFGS